MPPPEQCWPLRTNLGVFLAEPTEQCRNTLSRVSCALQRSERAPRPTIVCYSTKRATKKTKLSAVLSVQLKPAKWWGARGFRQTSSLVVGFDDRVARETRSSIILSYLHRQRVIIVPLHLSLPTCPSKNQNNLPSSQQMAAVLHPTSPQGNPRKSQ